MSYGLALSMRVLPLPVALWPEQNNATPSLQPHYRTFITTTGCSAPVPRIGTLTLIGSTYLDFSASERQVPAFHIEAWFRVTPPSRRMPPGQQSGHPPGSSRVNEIPPVSTSSCTFRRVISGSLTLVSLTLT